MASVKVSVCIPVYNGAEYIGIAIDSVLNQTFRDFEIIVVDNCSRDNTVAIVKNYKDARIRLVKNETNIGMVPNWNKAISIAEGAYIKILPADDFIYPQCLELQCAVLDNDPEQQISLVCGRKNVIDDKGKILFNRGFAKIRKQVPGTAAVNAVMRSGGNTIGEGGAVLFRRSILEKTGPFTADIFYVLDLDLWFKMLLHGDLYALPDVVSAFRISHGSASVQVAKKQRQDNLDFMKKIYHNRAYKLSGINYRIGIFTSFIINEVKGILYKYIL